MSTKNLSLFDTEAIPSAEGMRFGIVVADWNKEITELLLEGSVSTLLKHGVDEEEIMIIHVPGSFELTLGAQWLAEYEEWDGIICLGCVIHGETPHFDYICQSVSRGLTELNMEYNIPFVFGVLTTNNFEQASARAGGKLGNKGVEAAITAIKMAALQADLEQ